MQWRNNKFGGAKDVISCQQYRAQGSPRLFIDSIWNDIWLADSLDSQPYIFRDGIQHVSSLDKSSQSKEASLYEKKVCVYCIFLLKFEFVVLKIV